MYAIWTNVRNMLICRSYRTSRRRKLSGQANVCSTIRRFVPSQSSPVLARGLLASSMVQADQFHSAILQSVAQPVGIVAQVGHHVVRLDPRRLRHTRIVQRRRQKFRFRRGGQGELNSQRNTFVAVTIREIMIFFSLLSKRIHEIGAIYVGDITNISLPSTFFQLHVLP